MLQLKEYESIRAENLRAGRYVDVAYIEGYTNGLMYLLADNKEQSTSRSILCMVSLDSQ